MMTLSDRGKAFVTTAPSSSSGQTYYWDWLDPRPRFKREGPTQ